MKSVIVQILSVNELRHMRSEALETYKARVCLAALSAPTELEREGLRNQVLRVNTILNERPMEVCRY